jgi:hypothetical protein
MSAVWTTMDGRQIEIRWMQSQHLVHSLNMIMRKNRLTKRHLLTRNDQLLNVFVTEVRERGLWQWAEAPIEQLYVPTLRETPAQLCMLRAILDVKPKNWEDIIGLFKQNPEQYIAHVLSCADPKWVPVVAKFTEYRLEGR